MRMDFLTAVDPSVSLVERPALLAALSQEKFRLADEREKERRLDQRDDHEHSKDATNIVLLAELDRIEEAELRVRMDQLQHAVIEALIANEEALADAQRTVDRMLGQATVLADGRRVFKTEDGLRVFDEHGQEVGPEEIIPAAIGDERPRWEKFDAAADKRDGLADERRELLDYQHKLDEADAKMAAGTMKGDDLAELDRLMSDDVPAAVRQRLPSEAVVQQSAAAAASLGRPVEGVGFWGDNAPGASPELP